MAELTEAQKARIRAEEEARAQALLEARYREQVRAELEGTPGLTAEPAEPATAQGATVGADGSAPTAASVPRPEGRGRGGGASGRAVLWSLSALLGLGGVALTTWGLARAVGGAGEELAEDGPADVEVVTGATGPVVAAPEARWDAADLGYTAYELGPDGALREVSRAGPATHEALARELVAHEEAAGRGPAPAPAPLLAELEARVAVAADSDPLLRWVPPDAFIVVGIDFAEARRVPALARLRDALLEFLAVGHPLASLDALLGLDVVGRGGLALFAFPEAALREDDEERLIVARVPYDADRIARWARGADPGLTTRDTAEGRVIAFRDGGLVLGDGFALAAAPRSFAAAQRARSGTSALVSGALSEPLRDARVAPHAFAAMRWPAGPRDRLPPALAILGDVTWLRVRVVVRGARLGIEVAAQLADAGTATRLLALLDGQRRGPAAALLADVTLDREGRAVVARASFDDDALRRWIAASRAVP